ncbi:MAG: hypothetical protein C0599_09955 [Salinivirgaceae bacterium]|nr:MAG: hypothetical protein C0599_09955 [Salinivirgaceae bacterium]
MKKLTLIFAAFLSLLFYSCGGGVEVSPEMQGFMDEINATNSMIDAAEKYGYNADEMPLDLYELKDPTVTKVEKDGDKTMYYTNFKHGIIDSDVIICWKDKVIVNIKDVE